MKDYIRREGDAVADIRQLLKNGEPIPDELAVRLLKQRLDMPDCKTNGWVLMGAPTNLDQISMMKEFYNQQPNYIITMDLSDHIIFEKLEQKRFDPVTNREYFILSENIKDE